MYFTYFILFDIYPIKYDRLVLFAAQSSLYYLQIQFRRYVFFFT